MNIDELKKAIQSLSTEERRRLLSDIQIEHFDKGDYVSRVLNKKETRTPIPCPHCGSSEVISRGIHKGVKRYQCNSCGKYFAGNYGTSLHWIHKKDKWQHYIECMNDRLSLRESASRVGISYRTAFIWRHKILSSLKDTEPGQLGGIVEADDTYFRFSEKGKRNLRRKAHRRGGGNMKLKKNKVPVVVATDRKGNMVLNVAGKGTLKREDLRNIMAGKFKPDTILCSDGANAYKGLAIQEGIKHIKSTSLRRPVAKNKAYNIQTVNQIQKDLKDYIRKFNGVSSKYLQNYLYWFMYGKRKLTNIDKIKQWIWITITYGSALNLYHRIIAL